jgi:hypothetical protein
MTLLASIGYLHAVDNLRRVQPAFRWVLNAHHKPRRLDVAVSARSLPLTGWGEKIAINCNFCGRQVRTLGFDQGGGVPDMVPFVLYINHKVDRFAPATKAI